FHCPQNSTGRSTITALYLDWETDQFIGTGLHLRKIEAFDNPDASSKQRMMCFRPILVEPTNRKIINTNGLNVPLSQILSSFMRDIHEILHEVTALPTPTGVLCLEEYYFTLTNLVRLKLVRFD